MTEPNDVQGLSFGQYEVLERLALSRSGQVFKVRHRRMGRLAVIKALSQEATASPELLERFHRKVQILAQLKHPNVVAAYEAGERDGLPYLVTEYVDGYDLWTLLKKFGPLPILHAVDYMRQAATGLGYAHSQGVCHRNVKPSNLMVDKQGIVKVIGLGLARVQSDSPLGSGSPAGELTQPGQAMGTYDFMAPEQAVDAHSADPRADVYSLGCTLHALMTGRSPYSGKSPVQQAVAHRSAPIPSLRALRTDAPEALDAVFRKMLAKKPEDRFASMDELIGALEKCSPAVEPAAAQPASEAESLSQQTFNALLVSLGHQKTDPRQPVPQAPPVIVKKPPAAAAPAAATAPPRKPQPRRKPVYSWRVVAITAVNFVLGVTVLALVLAKMFWWTEKKPQEAATRTLVAAGEAKKTPPPVKPAEREPPRAAVDTSLPAPPKAPSPGPIPGAQPPTPPPEKTTAAEKPAESMFGPAAGPKPDTTVFPSEKPPGKPAPSEARAKLPLPDEKTAAAAEKIVRETYKDELTRASTPARQTELAEKFVRAGTALHDDPAGKFVLLRMAYELAEESANETTAFAAIDELANGFRVDALAMKADLLSSLARSAHTANERKSLSQRVLATSSKAFEEGRFKTANRLAKLALNEATKARDKEAIQRARFALRDSDEAVRAATAAEDAAKVLEKTPNDAEANQAAGWYQCCMLGQWETGLPKLAAGSDEAVRALAARDLANPTDWETQMGVADQWWDLADKKSALVKKQLQQRAGYWYAKAAPNATGLLKTKAEKRLESLKP